MPLPRNLGELRAAGHTPRTVKEELRANLIARLRSGEPTFPGLVGYDRTVVPQVENALLAGHDFLLLGLRGQAKTRLLRSLDALLDEHVPAIEGSPLNEDPLRPLTAAARARVEREGDALPIRWIPRSERYREKLATPDVSVADLIGDVDPIKAAKERRSLDDPEVLHYGILPRSNRGIFAINELPDLQARIQVALLNVLEEGDVQLRGFPVRLPLDLLLVFSANPEDYTNRGNIITPLRDRIAAQILTHYPRTLEESLAITDQEAWVERGGDVRVRVPEHVRIAVEEVGFQARASELVDQSSGVSARMTIALYESVVSSAERRALKHGAREATARVSDLYTGISAVTGKIELVYEGEREGPRRVALTLVGKALAAVFREVVPPDRRPGEHPVEETDFASAVSWFGDRHVVEVADDLSDAELLARLRQVPGLEALARRLLPAGDDAHVAAGMELLLEGLHQSALLSREDLVGGRAYKDPFEDVVQSFNS